MNFLQLCQRTRAESSISGEGPTNVSGQTGMYGKIVNWVKQAHEEIQLMEAQWRFDWLDHEDQLVAGKASYSPSSDWGLLVKQWIRDGAYVYRTEDGPNSKHWPMWIDWREYQRLQQQGVNGLPVYWTEGPDKKLYFYPSPDRPLNFYGEYYAKPEVLTGNTDTPRMPEEYHMAIVWRAVMFCANDIEDAARYVVAKENYMNLLMKMRTTELIGPTAPEPLA